MCAYQRRGYRYENVTLGDGLGVVGLAEAARGEGNIGWNVAGGGGDNGPRRFGTARRRKYPQY
jgi:hypothetical protein